MRRIDPTASGAPRSDHGSDVAVVHDAFTQLGGGERVGRQIAAALDAPLFAAAIRRRPVDALEGQAVSTTFVQGIIDHGLALPWVAPLLPAAFGSLDVGPVRVVVSSTAAFAHHVRIPAGAIHLCYCHTPPRFLWEPEDYFRGRPVARAALSPGILAMRRLDLRAARRVHVYLANSRHVAAKIRRVYGREAFVVHPPTDTGLFRPTLERSGRFLVVSRLQPQKRIDLAIRAATSRGLELDVVGDGPELDRLRRLAGPTVRFLGPRPDPEVRALMARCVAVIVPAVQDFGLTLVEAQASGRPPIAFGEGGALEVVEDGRTGFLFHEQTPEALGACMERASRGPLDVSALVGSAGRFDAATFRTAIRAVVDVALAEQARHVVGSREVAASGATMVGQLERRELTRAG